MRLPVLGNCLFLAVFTFVCVCVCEIGPPPHESQQRELASPTYGRRDLFFFRSTRLPTPSSSSSTFLFFFYSLRLLRSAGVGNRFVVGSRVFPSVLCSSPCMFFFSFSLAAHRHTEDVYNVSVMNLLHSLDLSGVVLIKLPMSSPCRYLHQFQSPLEQPKGIRNTTKCGIKGLV